MAVETERAPDRTRERKERAQARARQDILEAALRAFVASGYRDTKMADIAAEAGYTAASLYTYFASKRDIIHALADMLVDELAQAWGPLMEPGPKPVDFATFAGRMRERIRGALAHVGRRREALAFFLRMRYAGEPELAVPAEGCLAENEHDMKIRRRVEAVLESVGLSQVSSVAPEVVSSALAGLMESLVLRGMVSGSMPNVADEAERITSFLLYGIRGER